MGWIYETLYCTIKSGKWENRGFLYGPVCPIYGTGAIAISILIHSMQKLQIEVQIWQLFIIAVIGSAILEYLTSWALEKIFHALWWDYSTWPFNLNGRISLFTSFGFSIAGLLIIYYIAPFTEKVITHLSPIETEIYALIFVAIFMVDLTLTVSALLHFDRIVMQIDNNFNNTMERVVDHALHPSYILQDIADKRIDIKINLMNKFEKDTIKRIGTFRYKADAKEKLDKVLHNIKRKNNE